MGVASAPGAGFTLDPAFARSLVTAVPHPVFVLDGEAAIVFANSAMDALLGRAPEDVIGLGPDGFAVCGFADDDLRDAVTRVIGTGRPVRIETTIAGHPLRWFEWFLGPLATGDGGSSLVAGFGQDITARKRMDAEMRAAQQQAEDLIRSAPTGIYEIDFTGPRFLSVNDAMCVLSGYSREELLAMSPIDLLLPESQELFRKRISATLAGEVPNEEVEYRVRRRDGSVIFVELKVRFKMAPDGAAPTALVIGHDVTDRIVAARERERLLESEKSARRQAKRELERVRVMLQAERAIARERSLDDLLVVLCRVLIGSTGHARVTASLWDESRDAFVLAAAGGAPQVPPGLVFRLDDLSAEARSSVELRRAAVVPFDPSSPGTPGDDGAAPHRSLLVPLVFRERVLGVLSIDDKEEAREFARREVAIAEGVASQAAAAVENARLLRAERTAREQERQRSEHLSLLRDIAEIGASLENRAQKARRQVELVRERLDVTGAFVFLVDEGKSELVPFAGAGRTRDAFAPYGPVPFDDPSGIATAYRNGEPVVFADVGRDAPDKARDFLLSVDIRALATVPLRAGERVIGTMSVSLDEPHSFSVDEVAFLQSLAAEMALGLQNARLLESERARRHRIEVLHGVMDVAVATLDLHQAAKQMLAYLAKSVGFSLASITFARGGQLELLASRGYTAEARAALARVPASANLGVAAAFRAGRSVAFPDATIADEQVLSAQRSLGLDVGAFVVIPLRARGNAVGTLAFGWPAPRDIGPDDMEFYESLGAELGVVLENARLYEIEREIADRLQEALLSIPTRVSGLDFSHAYRSATESTRVGGDFYDLFELDADRVGIVIGDVAGKGLDAAVLTSLVRNTIHAHANERSRTPEQTLALTNQIVFRATPVEAFATVFYGVLDRRDGRLRFANAGHTTSALVFADGRVARLVTTGPILGAFPSARFVGAEARVGIGDTLFLYTDGLTEARREGELFGEERLFARLAGSAAETPTDIVIGALGDVISFSGGVLKDDVAVLALRRVEQGPGVEEQLTLPL